MTTATATATSNGTTTLDPSKLSGVIDKMRDIQTEGDRWELAEALKGMIPQGSNGFSEIIDKATSEGVVGNLSANTLRLYRDTATRWPSTKRVANVSFSAHREAMALPTIDSAAKMLGDLAKTQGASKVTVASVRKAVAIKNGRQPTAAQAAGTTTHAKNLDVIRDLTSGGSELIKAIGAESDTDKLDKMHAGLNKVIAHVERLRAKAARASAKKATPEKKATNGAKPSTPKATAKKSAGDMRDL